MASVPPVVSTDLTGTVLCIEDDPVGMTLVEAMLAAHSGVSLLKAVNGQNGVALARSRRPDLVLLDMGLPDMGGLEVVRLLSESISRHGLRIVLLTAEPFSMDVVKAMSLGAHEYWPKPLNSTRVTTDLRRVLADAAASRRDAGAAR